MKETIITIIKICIIILIVAWMVLFVYDYFRATNNTKPVVCLSETTITLDSGKYYKCTSFGYKYYEYTANDGNSSFGFGAAFIKNDLEKDLGV